MLTESVPRDVLRFDLVYFAVGVLILTVAVLTLMQAVAQRFRSRLVSLFGLVGLIYGARLLLQLRVVQVTLGIRLYTLLQIWSALQYLIPVGGIYLWSYFVSRRSRKVVLVLVTMHAVFALYGIPHDLITHSPWSFPRFNSVLVLASSLIVAALIVLDILQGYITLDVPLRAVAVGFVLFQAGVLYDNLSGLRLVPNVWTEPFAFTAFLCAMGFAIQYRVAADRSRLVSLRTEMEQARRIQLSILPSESPANSHYQVAANYSPMTSVAGDLYDFLPLADDRLGLFIADVAGHGLPAALVASMLKTAVNLQAQNTVSPAELLGELNRLFCGQTHGQFVTAALAVLEPHAQTLTYSAAGHPPLLIWGNNGDGMRELEENGLPLGILSAAEYAEVTVPFKPGTRLALYTDGIVESENSRAEEFGRERLSAVLRSNHGDAQELIRRAMDAVEHWRGREHEQADDLTLLVAEYKPSGQA